MNCPLDVSVSSFFAVEGTQMCSFAQMPNYWRLSINVMNVTSQILFKFEKLREIFMLF